MDNRAYLERSASYDVENEGKSRTMLKKARLICEAIDAQGSGRPADILEVGCGTGLFTRLLATRFPDSRITATDAFTPMLERAGQRLSKFKNVELLQYDAETEGTFPQRFDFVCGVDLIHHLKDPAAGLAHWRSCTNIGGMLVFFESNPRNPVLYLRTRNRPEEERFKYNTKSNLTAWLTVAGWKDVVVRAAPIYLPNGSPGLWRTLGTIEGAMHVALWPISGGMVLCARNAG